MHDEFPLCTLNDVLDHAARRFADRTALTDGPFGPAGSRGNVR